MFCAVALSPAVFSALRASPASSACSSSTSTWRRAVVAFMETPNTEAGAAWGPSRPRGGDPSWDTFPTLHIRRHIKNRTLRGPERDPTEKRDFTCTMEVIFF